jgi:hypothetical protein
MAMTSWMPVSGKVRLSLPDRHGNALPQPSQLFVGGVLVAEPKGFRRSSRFAMTIKRSATRWTNGCPLLAQSGHWLDDRFWPKADIG